jgi:hypothetical protein
VNKKNRAAGRQKNFVLAAFTPALPQPPFSKRFLLLFFKKEVLA